MLDATAKKLISLLDSGKPVEVRGAAVKVLGEIGNADKKVAEELCGLLLDADKTLRRPLLEAVGKLQIAEALPRLLELVQAGGEDAPLAAKMAARLGTKGAKGLQDLLPQVTPGQRPYIAAALGGAGTARAESAALEFLRTKEASVIDAAVRSLIAQVPSFSPAHRRVLIDHLLELMEDRKQPLPAASEGGALRLLAALGAPAAIFWPRINPAHSYDIRALALQALGKVIETPTKEQFRQLFACAREREFRVAGPALLILQNLPVSERNLDDWLALLEAPDLAARQLALSKVKEHDTAPLARVLLKNLDHPDRNFRDEVLAVMRQLEHGRKALTQALLDAKNADEAWKLARAQVGADLPAKARKELLEQTCTFLEEGDRRAEPLLFLFREGQGGELNEQLLERALVWRKKKAYDKALVFLRLLGRDPTCSFPVRLELALCGLKVSAKDVSARGQDACLTHFEHLALTHEAELVKHLEKTKWLDPEDLFYLGFHLAEKEGRPKKVGGAVLKLLGKRSPKSKLAQAAKTKLRGSGLS